MISIGLDVGTAFVKGVSDTARIRFPSLYAYKLDQGWADKGRLVEGVGDDAVKISQDPDAIVIRPVMLGRPVHEEAFARLVRHAVMLSPEKRDALGSTEEMAIAVGLPYDAGAHRSTIQKMIAREYHPKACDIVPQVLGTLVDTGVPSGIVTSIGQGTTEIVAFVNNRAIRGTSVHHAVEYISSRLGAGQMGYLDDSIYSSPKTGKLVKMLADSILNKLQGIRQDLEKLPVIISGGGILVPGMQEALKSELGDIVVPQDPVMSNAQGLYKIASWYGKQDRPE